jgi:hypothetical protein
MHNPPHPGEFIIQVYLDPNNLSGCELAGKLGVVASMLNRILTEWVGEKVARTRGSTGLPLKKKLRMRITRTVETTPADSRGCQET